jgi:GntR family transcriptional repressor for pyruvate dehydrogenase complex
MLKPVKQRKISDQIYEQIRDLIYRGEYRPGERLMAERDLASLFKVGRPTVRSAIQKLIDNGLVIARRGVGTFVADNTSQKINSSFLQMMGGEEFSVTEFQETRMALEVKSAELAAQRSTDDDIRLLKKSHARVAEELVVGNPQMNSDISFHMNIAYATKNIFHIQMMKSIYEVQHIVMDHAYAKLLQGMKLDDLVLKQHANIMEAIISRNSVQARQAMEAHLGSILDICRENGL